VAGVPLPVPKQIGLIEEMKWISEIFCTTLFRVSVLTIQTQAESASFTNFLVQGERSERNGDVPTAEKFYSQAERLAFSNAPDLCVLTKNYCDLMYSVDSAAAKKGLVKHAMACASRAVSTDPKSPTAHACMAVCYAKESAFADIKTKVTYSHLIKNEADKTIALNPKQDVAYYLLGRWNYGVANLGLLPRTYVKVAYGGLPDASNGEAIKDFKQAITLAPNHIIYYAGLAEVYETTGQKTQARAEWEKCINLRPLDRDDEDARREAATKLNSTSQ
jgi:tetratricopeptide (TPR) repeat protein